MDHFIPQVAHAQTDHSGRSVSLRESGHLDDILFALYRAVPARVRERRETLIDR